MKQTSKLTQISIFICQVIAIVVLSTMIIISCKPTPSKECDFVVSGYRLSKYKEGHWAIIDKQKQILGYSIRYRSYGFYEQSANEAMVFSDSCRAKGAMKKYIESQNQFK